MKPFKIIMKKIFDFMSLNKKHSQDSYLGSLFEDDLLFCILSNRKTIDSVRIFKISLSRYQIIHYPISYALRGEIICKNKKTCFKLPSETNFDDFLKRLVSFGKLHNFGIHHTIKYNGFSGKDEEIWISNRLSI
jgi:hypothetical protein